MDYDKSGLLYGLSGWNYKIAKTYMESIDYTKLIDIENAVFIAPTVRRCLSYILPWNNDVQFIAFQKDKSLVDEVLKKFNINDIMSGIEEFFKDFIEPFKARLPIIDTEAELIYLWSMNYVHSLIKEVLDAKSGISRQKSIE